MIGRGKVDSILKYDAVGFDMDHTFIRYKLRSFMKLVYDSTSIYLVNFKLYPQDIFPINEDDSKNKLRMYFRAVFDHKTGNMLKIGANNLIMRAYHGFRPLTREEIIHTYGKNPMIPDFEILSCKHQDFTNLHEFYGVSQVPILSQIVHLKTLGQFQCLNEKSYYDIVQDINDANNFNYGIHDIEKFSNRDYSGYFFPKFLSEPRNYIRKVSQKLLDKLEALQKMKIKIFIASNSFYSVANIIMKEAIGPDWLKHFDFVIYNCKKPFFFRPEADKTMFTDLKGNEITGLDKFLLNNPQGKEKVLIGGNAGLINDYLFHHVRKEFKVLFFGDTIVSDCVYAFDKIHDKKWDVVLIMEELQEVENGYPDKEYFNYYFYWGSALYDKNIYSGVDKTIIFDFADNIAHRSFSVLDSEEALEFLSIN